MRDLPIAGLAAAVPAQPSIDDLRREFATRELEGWLWPWLTHVLTACVVARIKPRYAASVYSPSGVWDAVGIWDLVQDFIQRRGVEAGAIERALTVAILPTGVKRYLEKALLNFTISERRRDTLSNVRRRLADVLADDARLRPLAGIGARAAYGLDVWVEEPPPIMDSASIRTAVKFIPRKIALTNYSTGSRKSPGLASSDLAEISFSLVSGTGRLWTGAQIMVAIEQRFVLHEEAPDSPSVSIDQILHVSLPTSLDPIIADELARQALDSLSGAQRAILKLMIDEPALATRALAERLGVSKSLVNNEQRNIRSVFLELALAGSEDQEQVLGRIRGLLTDVG